MRQQSLMLIQITGSTFWLLVSFFFVVFDFFCLSGFCFIRNHASSLVVDIFFPTISLKKKKSNKNYKKICILFLLVRADSCHSHRGCLWVGFSSFPSVCLLMFGLPPVSCCWSCVHVGWFWWRGWILRRTLRRERENCSDLQASPSSCYRATQVACKQQQASANVSAFESWLCYYTAL